MRRCHMIKPLPADQYDHATTDELAGMIVTPQLVEVILFDTDHKSPGEYQVHCLANLVGWTSGNVQIYVKPDGYLGFAKEKWCPVDRVVGSAKSVRKV